jgi:Uma2 family endonuclease
MSVEPTRHSFTVDEYERIGAAGLLPPDRRLELIDGDIIEMTPIGPPHAYVVDQLAEWAMQQLAGRARVRVQGPVRISDLTEPEPDLMVLRPAGSEYRSRHPRPDDVLLVIEVSDTTAHFDRRVKRPLYATAGISELWIVDLGAHLIEIATSPAAGRYEAVRRVRKGQVAPRAFPDMQLTVEDLLD